MSSRHATDSPPGSRIGTPCPITPMDRTMDGETLVVVVVILAPCRRVGIIYFLSDPKTDARGKLTT